MDAGTAVASRRVAIPAGSQMSPAAWGGRVLIADNEGTLLIFGASDWQLEAKVATEAVQPVAIAATVAGDRAFFADRKGLVVCVDLAAKTVAWQRKLDAAKSVGVFQDLAVDAGVVCAYAKNTLYVLSAGSGAPLYAPIAGVSAPALLAGGELVYGTTDGSLKIATAATGKVLKSLALEARVAAQPLATGDRLVLALANGELLMVYPASIR
jgi:outer membrane protein assembly factor BamB